MKFANVHLSNGDGEILSTYKVAIVESESEMDDALVLYDENEIAFVYRNPGDVALEGASEALGHDLKVFLVAGRV